LRGLQQIEFFNDPDSLAGGRWSWLAYFITLVVGAITLALAFFAINKEDNR
jgi:hypothetical protein